MPQPELNRRTLVSGAAWSIPAVTFAAAVPAFAASLCPQPGRIDWAVVSTYVPSTGDVTSTTMTRIASFDPDLAGPLQPISVIVTSVAGSNTAFGDQKLNLNSRTTTGLVKPTVLTAPHDSGINEHLKVTTGVVGGRGDRALIFHQSPVNDAKKSSSLTDTANQSVTTFTFREPVSDLRFTIMDIDGAVNDFLDTVSLTSSSRYSSVISASLMGTGATADPCRPSITTPVNNDTAGAEASITFPEPVTSFALIYGNALSASTPQIDGDQKIVITGLTLTHNAC